MKLNVSSYKEQTTHWPGKGRHILAQYDDNSIVVYQAYRSAIGHFAAANGYFGGEFSLNRMSWIKPNFLWMMYRCGWATKLGQEVVLAIRLKREAFDTILEQAVHSTFVPSVYETEAAWKVLSPVLTSAYSGIQTTIPAGTSWNAVPFNWDYVGVLSSSMPLSG